MKAVRSVLGLIARRISRLNETTSRIKGAMDMKNETTAEKAKSGSLAAAINAAMEKPAASADLLERIRTAASELYAATQDKTKKEEELKTASAKVLQLRTQALPQLLDEAGIPGLDIDEATRVERDTEIY